MSLLWDFIKKKISTRETTKPEYNTTNQAKQGACTLSFVGKELACALAVPKKSGKKKIRYFDVENPVDRAFSSYTHLLREGFETLPFEESLFATFSDPLIGINWSRVR